MALTVLHVAPHPDDEALGAPCTLLRLVDAGARVVVVACGLGRPSDHARRLRELQEATVTGGFELLVRDPPAALASNDDLFAAQAALTPWLVDLINAHDADLVVSPQLYDVHPAHEAVARAVRDAVPGARRPPVWWAWGIWADLHAPTLLIPTPEDVVEQALVVLSRYTGEVARNDYPDMLRAVRRLGAIRGVERVLGFGSAALSGVRYAELLTEVGLVDGRWRFGVSRVAQEPTLPQRWAGTASGVVQGYAMPIGAIHGRSSGGGGRGEPAPVGRRIT